MIGPAGITLIPLFFFYPPLQDRFLILILKTPPRGEHELHNCYSQFPTSNLLMDFKQYISNYLKTYSNPGWIMVFYKALLCFFNCNLGII